MRSSKLSTLVFMVFLAQSALFGQKANSDRLITSIPLFNGRMALASYSLWLPIGTFSLPQKVLIQNNAPIEQKWRLKISYSVINPSHRFALQARVDLNQKQSPIFSIAWDDGRIGQRQVYTNWLQPELLGFNARAIFPISLNVIPSEDEQDPVEIVIHSVELEIWEIVTTSDRTVLQIASLSNPVGRIGGSSSSTKDVKKTQDTTTAMQVSLNFLRAASTGGLQNAKQYLSRDVLSLSQLAPISTAQIPLLKLPEGMTFEDYLANYDPQIFSYSQFAGLFDDLESHQIKKWSISPKSYLFIGNNVKSWGKDILPDQPLVFLLEEEDGVMKIKAFP